MEAVVVLVLVVLLVVLLLLSRVAGVVVVGMAARASVQAVMASGYRPLIFVGWGCVGGIGGG